MPIRQSRIGRRQQTPPTAYVSGDVMSSHVDYVFDAATMGAATFSASLDKLELAVLPAGAQLVGAQVIGANFGAITGNIGLMSGEVGSTDNARTSGSEIFSAISINNNEARATLAACLAIAPSNQHRSIGFVPSADVAAGATKRLTLRIEYVF